MSQGPICNAATWIGQRYCSNCNSYLPDPGEEDHFCPKCGIRVAPQQETCHKCNASLPEMTGAAFQTLTRARRRPPWVTVICIGTGLVSVVLFLAFLFHKSPGPPQRVPPPAPPASRQTPATSSPKIETVLSAPAAQELAGTSAPAPPSPPELKTPVAAPPRYLVNVRRLALRDGPTRSAPRIANLKFKDEVELLDTSDGWGKIREVRRNLVGWSNMRYLAPATAIVHSPASGSEPRRLHNLGPYR
jgi:predicted RNA-binding Zn-ribbon protein involved in translation (DUF1610 family)